jgi:hypothetical protein
MKFLVGVQSIYFVKIVSSFLVNIYNHHAPLTTHARTCDTWPTARDDLSLVDADHPP